MKTHDKGNNAASSKPSSDKPQSEKTVAFAVIYFILFYFIFKQFTMMICLFIYPIFLNALFLCSQSVGLVSVFNGLTVWAWVVKRLKFEECENLFFTLPSETICRFGTNKGWSSW